MFLQIGSKSGSLISNSPDTKNINFFAPFEDQLDGTNGYMQIPTIEEYQKKRKIGIQKDNTAKNHVSHEFLRKVINKKNISE